MTKIHHIKRVKHAFGDPIPPVSGSQGGGTSGLDLGVKPPSPYTSYGALDYLPKFDVYSPYAQGLDQDIYNTPGHRIGSQMHRILLDTIQGKDTGQYGLSDTGNAAYGQMANYAKTWAAQNAQWLADNRSNPNLQQDMSQRFMTDAQASGIMPSGVGTPGIGHLKYVPKVTGHYGPLGGKDFQSRLMEDVQSGFGSAAGESAEGWKGIMTPIVRKKVMGNMGADLGGFYTRILKDLGKGSTNLIAQLLNRFSPGLSKLVSNLTKIDTGLPGNAQALGGGEQGSLDELADTMQEPSEGDTSGTA